MRFLEQAAHVEMFSRCYAIRPYGQKYVSLRSSIITQLSGGKILVGHQRQFSLNAFRRQQQQPKNGQAANKIPNDAPVKAETPEIARPESAEKSQTAGPNPAAIPTAGLSSDKDLSKKEQRQVDFAIMKEMIRYLWPKGEFGTKVRVATALSLLVGAKILNVNVPFYFKSIVDSMNIDFMTIGGTAWTVAGSMIVAYGVTRIGATVFTELRNAVFASVAQKAIRNVARNVFAHLLRLDLNFHLSRQTGGLTRALDRGTKGISFLLTSMLFHIFPTFLEITMVCGILTWNYGAGFAAVTAATMAAYSPSLL